MLMSEKSVKFLMTEEVEAALRAVPKWSDSRDLRIRTYAFT